MDYIPRVVFLARPSPRWYLRTVFVAAVVACWVRPAPAVQQTAPPSSTPQFRAKVDLVQVDVVVTDLSGEPIKGLTQGDFVVNDRGKPQSIAAFEEVSHTYAADAAAPALDVRHDVSDNRTAQSQRLVVVVVDDLHIFKGRTDRAKDLARQVIDSLGNGASMALLFTSGARGVEVTEDRSLLLAATDTIKGRQAIRRPHDASDKQSVHGLDPEMSNDQIRAAINTAGSAQDFFENMAQFKTLEDAARMIGASDLRRKAFVLISEGMSKDLTGVFTGVATPCELQPPVQRASPSARNQTAGTSVPTPCYHEDALRHTAEAMRRSNVTMYALDPRGQITDQELAIEGFGSPKGLLTTPSGTAKDEESPFRVTNPVRLAQDGLGKMSDATGGFAVTDTNDFQSGIDRIAADLDHYYLIGFLPADTTGDKYRPISVKVPGHPDWLLRFRAGYTPGGAADLPASADPLLSAALPKADVPLRLFVEPFPMPPTAASSADPSAAAGAKAAANVSRVAVALEVTLPTSVLMGPDGKLHDDVTYKIAAVHSGDGKVAGRVSRAAALVMKPIAAAAGSTPATVAYEVQSSIDLPPGSYQIRASLASGKALTGGSVYLPVDVPDFSRALLALSGVAVGYADGDRIAVAPAGEADPAGAPSAVPFAPTLDRLFRPSDVLRVFCQVKRAAPADTAHVSIELIDAKNTTVRAVARDVGATTGDVLVPVDERFSLSGMAIGAYRLRVTATHGSASARQEFGLLIR